MRSERVAITTRVARSFLRTGQVLSPYLLISPQVSILPWPSPTHSFLHTRQFELYGRRARRREADGLRQLEKLARHALRREYPQEAEADPAAPLQPQLLAMARAASRRFAFLAAEWVRVGYTQSNFNADNNLIGGATLDYGPFGFVSGRLPLCSPCLRRRERESGEPPWPLRAPFEPAASCLCTGLGLRPRKALVAERRGALESVCSHRSSALTQAGACGSARASTSAS